MTTDRRTRALVPALLSCLALAGCAGTSTSNPAPTQSPATVQAIDGALAMTLLAHIDVDTLVSVSAEHAHGLTAATQHEELPIAPGTASAAGNWGYTSPDGRRFALTGTSEGLSIVEVTNPAQPRNIGLIAGPSNRWREVKTYGTYAYVTTEAKHGLDIVDLSDPDHPEKVTTWDETLLSAHTLWADAERQLLFVNGAGDASGRTGLHVLSLADPRRPVEVGRFSDFYVHDSFTRGNLLFASAINDGFQAFLDVSDVARPRELARFFTGRRFTHNAALTLDGRYLFTTDERPDAPLEAWDIQDRTRPTKVSQFIARPGTIPHNVLIDGQRLLVAHYTEGVYLLDVVNPRQPRVLGAYDTYRGTETGFHGAWGAYVFPGSDLIVVSDIDGGLFVLRYDGR